MKRMVRTIALTLMTVLIISTSVFATGITPAQQLQQKLIQLGVPNTYIGNVVEYLQKIEITQEQADSILSKIDDAVILLDGKTDITTIDDVTKNAIKEMAVEAASVVGLRLTFGKDAKGVTTAILNDVNGKVILSLDTYNVIELLQDVDMTLIKEVFEVVVEFSNNPDKSKFDSISGELNNTGTNLGAVMVAGFGLIGLSGITFAGAKKAFR